MSKQDFQAGDVIEYGNGRRDYLVAIPGQDGLWVNACNPSWIERGLRGFCEQCYRFTRDDAEEAKVVGHFGDGSCTSAQSWYADNKELYR